MRDWVIERATPIVCGVPYLSAAVAIASLLTAVAEEISVQLPFDMIRVWMGLRQDSLG